jgi:hypothetical protein
MQRLRVVFVIALALVSVNNASAGRQWPSSIEHYAIRSISGRGASAAAAPVEPAGTLSSMLDGLEEHFGGPVHITAQFYAAPSRS